jgi:uridylate kinase
VSDESARAVYQRILLKFSGEVLMGDTEHCFDPGVLERVAGEVREVVGLGVQVAIVVGGGNLFRGASLVEVGINRVTADQLGMLATVMNALVMRDTLQNLGLSVRVQSAMSIEPICAGYDRQQCLRDLETGQVVIFAAGTGNPLFTTDSAASLRAIEIGADVVLKATKVDGVYSADPVKFPEAIRYDRISYSEALARDLQVMDTTAILLCRDHDMRLRVFDMNKPGALVRVVKGIEEGTLVCAGEEV